jgi:putative aldouronate transport system permease protein
MTASVLSPAPAAIPRKAKKRNLRRYLPLYAMALLPVAYFLIFRYMPLVNAQIAFKDFSPIDGVWGSPWVGFQNFKEFFSSIYFWELMRNTIGYSLAKLLIGLPLAIILALALSETCAKAFKGVVQTITYLPHFLSWVIMYGVLLALLSESDGWINMIIKATGGQTKSFLGSPTWFPIVVVLSDAWKETGWSAIIFLAALAGIDPALYEAAEVEGATRFQRIRYISIPGIMDTIIVVTLLRLGTVLDAGFHQIFMLYSMPVMGVGDILDTWVYRQGILDFRFSLATAVGLFKGVIGLAMVLVFNKLAKKFSGSSLY